MILTLTYSLEGHNTWIISQSLTLRSAFRALRLDERVIDTTLATRIRSSFVDTRSRLGRWLQGVGFLGFVLRVEGVRLLAVAFRRKRLEMAVVRGWTGVLLLK